jgi:hypothetical protein
MVYKKRDLCFSLIAILNANLCLSIGMGYEVDTIKESAKILAAPAHEFNKKFPEAVEKLVSPVNSFNANLPENIEKLVSPLNAFNANLPENIERAERIVEKVGYDIGSGTVDKVVALAGSATAVVSAKAEAAALAVKKAALAVTSPAALPYVAVGVGVIVICYGGYKIYRIYNPTLEQIAYAKKLQESIIKMDAKIAKKQLVFAKHKAVKEFQESLIRHKFDRRDAQGIPLSCQQQALHLSVVAGSKKLDKIVASFNKVTLQFVVAAA